MKISRKSKLAMQVISIALLTLIDQLIKLAVLEHLVPVGRIVVLDGFLAWTYAENTGAAFSIFSGNTDILSVFTAIALLGGLVFLFVSGKHHPIYDITVPLLLAGGLGNLIDRLFRGFVIDYIQVLFVNFPVFNFADCLVTCSAIALMIFLVADMIRDFKKEKKKKSESTEQSHG